MNNTLITGASGFTARKLIGKISNNKILVDINDPLDRDINSKFINCDLTNYHAISEIVKNYKPFEIYHLAGSFSNDYQKDFSINYLATKNLLDSVKNYF